MIYFNCGCGFRARNLDTAIHHVETTGHTLTAGGTITPEECGYTAKETEHGGRQS